MVSIVAHADHRDLWALDQQDELGHAASVLISGHAVDLVHQQDLSKQKKVNKQRQQHVDQVLIFHLEKK